MIKVLNREFGIIHTIQGQLISGNIDIDATSNIRRTGNISLKIKKNFLFLFIFGVENTKKGKIKESLQWVLWNTMG